MTVNLSVPLEPDPLPLELDDARAYLEEIIRVPSLSGESIRRMGRAMLTLLEIIDPRG